VILVDTNVLVALVDAKDDLHGRAARDLARARGDTLFTPDVVLSETLFLVTKAWARSRLRALLDALAVQRLLLREPWRDEVFDWLEKYASHQPDLADAMLVVASSREKRSRVWTYDGEFKTTWRRADGTKVPLFAP
jgi:predicted nucleic acid-binding protein